MRIVSNSQSVRVGEFTLLGFAETFAAVCLGVYLTYLAITNTNPYPILISALLAPFFLLRTHYSYQLALSYAVRLAKYLDKYIDTVKRRAIHSVEVDAAGREHVRVHAMSSAEGIQLLFPTFALFFGPSVIRIIASGIGAIKYPRYSIGCIP